MLSLRKLLLPVLQVQSPLKSALNSSSGLSLIPTNGSGSACYATSTSRTKVSQMLNLPEPPRKPLAPFIKYHLTIRPQILKDNPKLKATDITKLAGKKWSEISESEKAKMAEEYAKEVGAWSDAYRRYEDTLTTEQKAMIKNQTNELRFKRAERKKRADKKLHGKPKQPANPFSLYVEAKRKTLKDVKGGKNYVIEAAAEWRSMPVEEKQKYEEQARAMRERYAKELVAWEAKMIREGHPELVRLSSRGEINTPKRNTTPKKDYDTEKTKKGRPKKMESSDKE